MWKVKYSRRSLSQRTEMIIQLFNIVGGERKKAAYQSQARQKEIASLKNTLYNLFVIETAFLFTYCRFLWHSALCISCQRFYGRKRFKKSFKIRCWIISTRCIQRHRVVFIRYYIHTQQLIPKVATQYRMIKSTLFQIIKTDSLVFNVQETFTSCYGVFFFVIMSTFPWLV